MAVRRARVKPVISLLPWRKNNDAGNNTNTKTLEVETIEKLLKSPQTTLDTSTGIQDNVDKRSPKPDSALKSPLPVKNMFIYQVPSSLTVFPNASQKVWVMSENKVIESQRNVGSPIIGHVVPLLIQNSKAEVNNQRWPPLSPEKIPPMPNQKSEKRPAVTNFFYGKPKIPKKNVTCTIVSSDVPDYDSAPSMTEGTFIDGIVPLQATSTAPNSLVMNGIVSENGEVLFDPIVPLPSLSNERPKLQPVLRLSSLGKSSVQGSASESKDESGRALPVGYGPSTSAPWKTQDSHTSLSTMPALPNSGLRHVWNDSVISSVIQAPMPSAFTSSPVKDNHVSKCPRLDAARKAAAMRRRAEGTKDTLTMNDLIYYNPTSNPIVPDKDEMKAKEANEEEARKAAKESEGKVANTSGMKANRAPVPQIKLGPNGEIILDEKSLVIKQSEKRTIASSTVHESSTYNTVTARWNRRKPRSKDWTDAETLRFYRALTALGTDFIVMEQLFPDRNRRQLRYKFKKEERVNMPQIEKAIRVAGDWDPKRLLAEFTAEREAEEKVEEQAARERAAELQARAFERQQTRTRPRLSKSAKALGSSVLPSNCSGFTANDIIETYLEVKASKKKAIQRPCKRGGPKSKPSPAPATITQVLPNTQPSDDVATTRNIDSPKPPDKIPDGSSGILSSPGRPANIEDGALVIIPVVDPNNPSKKIYKTYIASKGGKLTLVDPPPPFLEKTLTVLGN